MSEKKSNDNLELSADPFSEDHEVTLMEKVNVNSDYDTLDETNEVTEKSFIEKNTNATPAQRKSMPLAPKASLIEEKSKSSLSAQQRQFQRTAFWLSLPVVLVIFVGILYVFQILLPEWTGQAKPSKPTQLVQLKQKQDQIPMDLFGPQDHNIKLSEIEIVGNKPEQPTTLPNVAIGSRLKIQFSLINWQTPPNKELKFRVAATILDQYGKLIYSDPNYKNFSQLAEAKNESLLVENELFVTAQTPIGVYTIRFEVIDESSQKAQTLQTQFRVLSKK